jgi:hypothetical protein
MFLDAVDCRGSNAAAPFHSLHRGQRFFQTQRDRHKKEYSPQCDANTRW